MKFDKRTVLCGAVAGLLCSPIASALSLQEAVQKTVTDNPEVQTSKEARLSTEQRIDQAKAGYFPEVNANAGIGWERANNPTTRGRGDNSVDMHREEAGIRLRQMVFDGLATPGEVRRQRAATDADAYRVYSTSENTALEAVRHYLEVLTRRKAVEFAEDNLKTHQQVDDQIRLRGEAGIGKMADSDQSKARLALAETNLINEQGNLRDAETAFLRVIGALPGELIDPVDPKTFLPKTLDEAVELAIANRPELKAANADIDEAFAQHDVARAPFMPRLDIELGANYGFNLDGIEGKDEDISAMLRMRYNLLNGGKDTARRRETAHEINRSKDVRDDTYRQTVESMRLSWVAFETTKSQLEFRKEHMERIIQTNVAYKKQFNIGQRTLLDLLDTANEVFTAKRSHVETYYDVLFSMYRILASMGALNKSLDVALPEEAKPIRKKDG